MGVNIECNHFKTSFLTLFKPTETRVRRPICNVQQTSTRCAPKLTVQWMLLLPSRLASRISRSSDGSQSTSHFWGCMSTLSCFYLVAESLDFPCRGYSVYRWCPLHLSLLGCKTGNRRTSRGDVETRKAIRSPDWGPPVRISAPCQPQRVPCVR